MKSSTLLKKWIDYGIDYRLATNPLFEEHFYANEKAYGERNRYEFGVIDAKEFWDYFLVASDLMRYAKSKGNACGPGRGSAAGSLVCYELRITEINSMTNDLMMFERFLDESRTDWPDIDMDFADQEMIFEYARQKYGAERVSHIGNFQRWRGRSAVKDIGKAYQLPMDGYTALAKLIVDKQEGDPRENDSVADAVEAFEAAQDIVERHPELKYAMPLEGTLQRTTIHAAGMVIANTSIEDICAVYSKEDDDGNHTVIAYDKRDAEYLNLLKLDILGLSTMAMIQDVVEMVGGDLTMEKLYALPLDDPRTLEGFRRCDLTGIFQFDGRTTRNICERIFRNTEEDSPVDFLTLADINALSRPGSLISGMTGRYIDVMQNKAEVEPIHPAVDPILSSTNGCLVYQEQVMKIGSIVGGFDGGKVSALRKIIGKKKGGDAFEEFFAEFAGGAKRLHGMPESKAREIWDWMAAGSKYLFNIAHAYAYAVIAYQAMYLKVRYPAEFYAASLRYAKKSKDKDPALALMQDAVRHGITVLPPAVGLSRTNWTKWSDTAVRAGYLQLPDVGPSIAPLMTAYCDEQWPMEGAGPINFKLINKTWADLQFKAGKKGRKTLPDEPNVGVPGFGPARVKYAAEMSEAEDPFGIHAAENACDLVHTAIYNGYVPLPMPTGDATWIDRNIDRDVVFVGMIKDVKIIDAIAAQQRRDGGSIEEVRKSMRRPDLDTKAKIICTDATGTEVHINLDRYKYPDFRDDLASAVLKRDVVHVQGITRQAFGPTVQADSLVVIDLSEED